MNLRIKRLIKTHALAETPKESCGFIYTTEKDVNTFACKNISVEPEEAFEIEQDQYFDCCRHGQVIGIYHSGRDAAFSLSDIHNADNWPLPLYLYSTNEDSFKTYIPKNYRTDYIGRQFIWGVYDCYTLVKDYYRREKNIHLGDYDCDESYETGQKQDIMLNLGKEGFLQSSDISSANESDVLIFKCGNEWHIGVYLGNNSFLHQPLRGQSRIEAIDGFWAKNLKFVLKHKTLL